MTPLKRDAIEKDVGTRARPRAPRATARPGADPLAAAQWDMQMIHATTDGSYARQQGSKAVRVGIIDTGIDGSHPDIAPNFNARLSRNFTVDDPSIDGACDTDPDGSCEDPANVDEDGHGTHVASTIGSPLNGIGIAGVAPKVELVNLRAGQDSGYFFLGPSLDALTYAGDHGIDVVNMSYYIDPWLYNCTANPADSPAEQREQTLVIEATQRAIDYARARGVTTIAAEGNGHTDLGKPIFDATSPDYPPSARSASARSTTRASRCRQRPTASSASRRSARRSARPTTPTTAASRPTSPRPAATAATRPTARARSRTRSSPPTRRGRHPRGPRRATASRHRPGDRRADHPAVVKQGGAYYQYIQGTSMASPHAVGVAALIVAEYGKRDRATAG